MPGWPLVAHEYPADTTPKVNVELHLYYLQVVMYNNYSYQLDTNDRSFHASMVHLSHPDTNLYLHCDNQHTASLGK